MFLIFIKIGCELCNKKHLVTSNPDNYRIGVKLMDMHIGGKVNVVLI